MSDDRQLKLDMAIERLKAGSRMALQYFKSPLLLTYSGGKDSQVLIRLAQIAGIPFEVLHSHTTADAPETVYFIREQFHKLEMGGVSCKIEYPRYDGNPTSMWDLIPRKLMPPTRTVRYCCAVLKEHGGDGRYIATGVRWAESTKRKQNRGIYEAQHPNKDKRIILTNDNDDRRKLFEVCAMRNKHCVNPIVDWTDADVWDFTQAEHLDVNPCYAKGFARCGCIGCPIAGTQGRQKEFSIYPIYEEHYIKAFDRMIVERKQRGLPTEWKDGVECFHWWMEDGMLPGQMEMEFDE